MREPVATQRATAPSERSADAAASVSLVRPRCGATMPGADAMRGASDLRIMLSLSASSLSD